MDQSSAALGPVMELSFQAPREPKANELDYKL